MKTMVEKLVETPEGLRLFQREKLILDLTNQVHKALREQKLSKRDLAEKLDWRTAEVNEFLDGERNLLMTELADVFTALGLQLRVSIEPISVLA